MLGSKIIYSSIVVCVVQVVHAANFVDMVRGVHVVIEAHVVLVVHLGFVVYGVYVIYVYVVTIMGFLWSFCPLEPCGAYGSSFLWSMWSFRTMWCMWF